MDEEMEDEVDVMVGKRSFSVLPGAKRADDGSRRGRVEALTRQVSFSSTGREWAAVSEEGLHVFVLDEDLVFVPFGLDQDITPLHVFRCLDSLDYTNALRMAIQLNESDLIQQALEGTPVRYIPLVVQELENHFTEKLCLVLGERMEGSVHLEFYLQWALELLRIRGPHLDQNRGSVMRGLRTLLKAVQTQFDQIKTITTENTYTLAFLEDQAHQATKKNAE